jgi:hypothetical protein
MFFNHPHLALRSLWVSRVSAGCVRAAADPTLRRLFRRSVTIAGERILSDLGTGGMGIFCSRLCGGTAVAAPASGGLLVCQQGHSRDCSVMEHSDSRPMARCIKLSKPGWDLFSI